MYCDSLTFFCTELIIIFCTVMCCKEWIWNSPVHSSSMYAANANTAVCLLVDAVQVSASSVSSHYLVGSTDAVKG